MYEMPATFREDTYQHNCDELINKIAANRNRWLLAPAMAVLRNMDDAEDVAQDVLFRLVRCGLKTYDPSRSLGAYVTQCAYFGAVNVLRGRHRRSRDFPGDFCLKGMDCCVFDGMEDKRYNGPRLEDVETRELKRQAVYDAMASLKPVTRNALLLSYAGMKYREIAEYLNMSVGTVKSTLHSARKAVRRLIEKRGGLELFNS